MKGWQIFLRHAHRDTEKGRELDNGLSSKGREQGQALVAFFSRKDLPYVPSQILSSPKKRCLETAEFLKCHFRIPLHVEVGLDEQGARESNHDFQLRVQEFYQEYQFEPGLVFVSHGDVLPLLASLQGLFVSKVRKGDFFLVDQGKLKLVNPMHDQSRVSIP